jgi:hypothetical protein
MLGVTEMVEFEFLPTILIEDGGLITSVLNYGWTIIVGTNQGNLLKYHLKKSSHGGKVCALACTRLF